MNQRFWVSWWHLGRLEKAYFDTAEERAAFVQARLIAEKPDMWETNSRGQRIIRREKQNGSIH
jgi:hypothetical protein